jgi:hypothetical protein
MQVINFCYTASKKLNKWYKHRENVNNGLREGGFPLVSTYSSGDCFPCEWSYVIQKFCSNENGTASNTNDNNNIMRNRELVLE